MSTEKKTYSFGVNIIGQPAVIEHFIPVFDVNSDFRIRNISSVMLVRKHTNQKNK